MTSLYWRRPIDTARLNMKVVMPQVDRDWFDQILVADGGATDGTAEWEIANGYEVHVQRGRGIRCAYFEAWPKIRGGIIVSVSPDGNGPPEALPRLLGKIQPARECTYGNCN